MPFFKGEVSIKDLEKAEITIIKLLNWKLLIIPPKEFVNFFMAHGVMFSSDKLLFKHLKTNAK